MYFDSHAHLSDRKFDSDREAVIARMQENGVTGMVDVGCDRASSLLAVRMAERYGWCWAAVGTHPDSAPEVTDALLDEYRALCQSPRVRAIGEIGLDYFYPDNPPRAVQKAAFRRQMALAQGLGMPVIIHDRDAHGDCLEIVSEFPQVRGVFHCFSGSVETAQELVRRGWYIGFTGVVTFKNARKAVEVAEWTPLSRILIETDCPYMAPEPHRGQRNDPGLVPLVAKKIAELKGISEEQVAKATWENARKLFRLPE